MSCEKSQYVSAHYDGELTGAELARFEEHLSLCPECRRELDELRQLSRLLARVPRPQMPAGALMRLHESAELVVERGVLRIAEWLTAAAAAVLVIGMMMLFREQPANAQPTGNWEQVAVTLQVDAPGSLPSDPLQVAELAASGNLPKSPNE